MTIVQLRPCRPEDLNQLVEIENLCFAEGKRFDRAYLHTCMTTMPFLIAEIEGLVAGFVICNVRNAQEAYLESLNVHPSFRRQRVASLLLTAMESFSLQNGINKMSLTVAVDNVGAIELYKRAGYAISAQKTPFYKDGTGAFEMSKALGADTSDSSTSHQEP